MTYSDKLKSPKWQKKRLEVLSRDEFKCCLCSDEKTQLHVHHLKYTKDPWDAPLEDLETLCVTCHSIKETHKDKKFVFAKKYLDHPYIIMFKTDDGQTGGFPLTSSFKINKESFYVCFEKNSAVLLDLYEYNDVSNYNNRKV